MNVGEGWRFSDECRGEVLRNEGGGEVLLSVSAIYIYSLSQYKVHMFIYIFSDTQRLMFLT